MVLHELATNAAKYGALSVKNGKVEIEWQRSDEPDTARIRLRWRELGGPPPATPERKGFGTRLIRQSLSEIGGTASISYTPDGLVCDLDFTCN